MKGSGISVVIPAYNRAGLIGPTLESLLKQTLPAEEILVVDDGSTDRTVEVAEGFGGPVRVIRQANAGPGAARNRGFQESTGEFIHFFDSDDIAVPNKHEIQFKALGRTGADIGYGPWIKGVFDQGLFWPEGRVYQQKDIPKGDLPRHLLTNWSVVPHACLFRRSIVEKSGGFPEDLRVAEDQYMFLSCLLCGANVVHTPGTLELYRLDNPDKLTENPQAAVYRAGHWAEFLIRAGRLLEGRGQVPWKWRGYLARLSAVREDLERLSGSENLISQIDEIMDKSGAAFLSPRQIRWICTMIGGARQRIIGHRNPSSFRCGKLTAHQIRLIRECGYHIKDRRDRF